MSFLEASKDGTFTTGNMTGNKSSFLKEKQTLTQKQPYRGDTYLESGFCSLCLVDALRIKGTHAGLPGREMGPPPGGLPRLRFSAGASRAGWQYWYGFLFQGDGPVGLHRLPPGRNLRPREVTQLSQRHTAVSPLNPIWGTPSLDL